ncbi:MAG: CRTAC1 family protein [Thiobacillaceae bacterium]
MNNTRRALRYLILVALLIAMATGAALWLRRPHAVLMFEDVTPYSGISYTGMTYGAAWGDFDGDGRPDLYLINHLSRESAKLFRNMGEGHFVDVTDKYFASQELAGDKHGAAWADYNNDGREDLVQLMGAVRGVGLERKRLFLNLGTRFEEVGETAGISNPGSRARMPLWFDFNGDGHLDLFEGAEARLDGGSAPFVFLQQEGGKFKAADEMMILASKTAPFCIITALDSDGHPELLCRITTHNQTHNRTAQVFPPKNPAGELDVLPPTAFEDVAAGDFDNDGFIDLFLARKNPPGPVALSHPAINKVLADTRIDQGNADKLVGFSFRSEGELTFRLSSADPSNPLPADQIHIGAHGNHPSGLAFTLSKETAGVPGVASHQPGGQAGIYVGFTPPDRWQVFVTEARQWLADGKSKYQEIQFEVTSSAAVANLNAIGNPVANEEAPARLFMNHAGKLIDESKKRGVNAQLVSAVNVVAGDFNNDMLLDLFVVASDELGKQKNLLLLNRGNGYFEVVADAGGAGGSQVGVGDSVTTVDYDGDGFLDLFVATGGSEGRNFGLPSESGAYHLYHNIGNGNHWIEIDLEGTKSNRDGIGALVYVTAGGVTQVRVQDGGVHHRGQNFQRLHFGLAKYTQINKITVHWPSGVVQELHGIKADQIMRIKEPGA